MRQVLLASAVAAVLCGCGGPKAREDAGKLIRVVRNVGSRESFQQHWDAWKAAFERDNPGWRMELVNVGNTQGSEFYMSRIATHDLPEVIQTWTLTRFLAENGHLVPMPDSYYERFGMPLPTPIDGKRYASMGGIQLLGVAVNRKAWQAIGITEPPATWEAFVAALKKLRAAGDKPLTYGAREWSGAVPLQYALATNLYAYRGETIGDTASWSRRKDAGETSFAADPAARTVMAKMIELLDLFAGKGALSDGYNEAKSEFFRGESATWLMGCWIGGDLEPNKVDLEIDYWPIPSMTGRRPIFVTGSYMQTGWAVTTSASGEKLPKAMAVMEALYDPTTYQTWLNAENMLATASSVAGVEGPVSAWPATQHFTESMQQSYATYGATRGYHVADNDQPPVGMDVPMKQVMQEILTGNHDADALLKKLDTAWDSLRKAEAASGTPGS